MFRAALLTLLSTTMFGFDLEPPPPPPEGIPLVITVLDAVTGRPIPFATVRETQEKTLKMVERATGRIVLTRLEPSYNDAVPLTKGMELTLEVTAAAYEPLTVDWRMKKRNNKLIVTMKPMKIPANIGSDPIIQFGRDRPLDGADLPPEERERIEREAAAQREARERQAPAGPPDER
jgi:hypothetical protein